MDWVPIVIFLASITAGVLGLLTWQSGGKTVVLGASALAGATGFSM